MYRLSCPSCGEVYDATEAADCGCIGSPRSFLCPHCGACLCSAPKGVLEKFWAGAPPELWRRSRQREMHAAVEEPGEIDPTRPVVLFADDDPTGCRIAREVIRSLGYTAVVATDGEQLLERARLVRPDLVITDALMPRRDGREVAKIIKEEMPKTRVVVITSIYKDPRYKYEAYRDFAVDEYLTKPIAPAKLREVIERLIPRPAGATA